MASKVQPKPSATIPPKAKIIHVFVFSRVKLNFLSMSGESAKSKIVVTNILTTFTAKADSENSNAMFIRVMLTPQTIAVAKAMRTPLNVTPLFKFDLLFS